ncbi:hypothetical protein C8R45DRAFT_1069910 [Mycena sanguinolenta]|nr:hypothetical protein C8R45DRAFT_1069910 [Mycena sanguinolenta]
MVTNSVPAKRVHTSVRTFPPEAHSGEVDEAIEVVSMGLKRRHESAWPRETLADEEKSGKEGGWRRTTKEYQYVQYIESSELWNSKVLVDAACVCIRAPANRTSPKPTPELHQVANGCGVKQLEESPAQRRRLRHREYRWPQPRTQALARILGLPVRRRESARCAECLKVKFNVGERDGGRGERIPVIGLARRLVSSIRLSTARRAPARSRALQNSMHSYASVRLPGDVVGSIYFVCPLAARAIRCSFTSTSVLSRPYSPLLASRRTSLNVDLHSDSAPAAALRMEDGYARGIYVSHTILSSFASRTYDADSDAYSLPTLCPSALAPDKYWEMKIKCRPARACTSPSINQIHGTELDAASFNTSEVLG